MSKIYIAYGSNMDVRQMAYRCPDARLVGTGTINNWKLLFKGSGSGFYATVERGRKRKNKIGNTVPVLVWEISPSDEKSLDRYEGCPTFYYKRNIIVQMESGCRRRGMVYIMHEERKLGLPSLGYYTVLAEAYEKFRFDMNILKAALIASNAKGDVA